MDMKRTMSPCMRNEIRTGMSMHAPRWYIRNARFRVLLHQRKNREDCKLYFWLGRMLRGTFCEYYDFTGDEISLMPTSGEIFTVMYRKRWTTLRRRHIYKKH